MLEYVSGYLTQDFTGLNLAILGVCSCEERTSRIQGRDVFFTRVVGRGYAIVIAVVVVVVVVL